MTKAHGLLICAVILLAACSSTPMAPASSSTSAPSTSTAAPVTSAAPKSVEGTSITTTSSLPAYLDPKSPISTNRSVYFDYNDFSIKKEYENMLEQHGKYLAAHPSVTIKVEGSTDERGGSEYNLALGQKRAEAVRHALIADGAKDSQMEAISWGKEKPKANGHDEASWAENRRADLDYPKQ
ncbi:MAG TPA: peptidoglycan-associated lipoprotein Pal [Burkholderiaceae bacterium]